jgi:hypothetical protein
MHRTFDLIVQLNLIIIIVEFLFFFEIFIIFVSRDNILYLFEIYLICYNLLCVGFSPYKYEMEHHNEYFPYVIHRFFSFRFAHATHYVYMCPCCCCCCFLLRSLFRFSFIMLVFFLLLNKPYFCS